MPGLQNVHEVAVNGPTGSHAVPIPTSDQPVEEDSREARPWHRARRSPSSSQSSRSEHEDRIQDSTKKIHLKRRSVDRSRSRSRSPMMRREQFSNSSTRASSNQSHYKYTDCTRQCNMEDFMCNTMCDLSPLPASVAGQPRVIIVHSPPLQRYEEPVMKDMENIAAQLRLVHNEVVEPFRQRYRPKPQETQMTGRILEMLSYQGLDRRFQCDKFNYTSSQNAIAVGLAEGRPSRKYNMLVASLLLFLDYHPGNLTALADVCPDSYYRMAVEYIRLHRLGKPLTELPVGDLFPGVTIMSNLLPAVLDEHSVTMPQDRPRPMTSAKSRGHKASGSKTQHGTTLSWQRPNSSSAADGYHPPTPPPAPVKDASYVRHAKSDKRGNKAKDPRVPSPPKPIHGRNSTGFRNSTAPTSGCALTNEYASWAHQDQEKWNTQSSRWGRG